MRRIITGVLVSLTMCPLVQADGRGETMYALTPSGISPWQQADAAAQAENDYLRNVDRNRAAFQQELEVYANRLAPRNAYYGKAINLFGAAVAASVSSASVHLNDSRTLGMVFRDAADSDRAVLIRYRKTW